MVLKGVVLAGDLPLDRLSLQSFEPGLVKHPAIVERIQAERCPRFASLTGHSCLKTWRCRAFWRPTSSSPGISSFEGP